jgi:uncharacterized protein (DUF983 family)
MEKIMPASIINAPSFAEMAPASAASLPRRDVWPAIANGIRGRCPVCGEGKIFRAYLKVNDNCPECGEELHHHRADDFPPYLTIVIVGHVVGSLLLLTEKFWPDAPLWLHSVTWPTLILILSLWLLPVMKGGAVAYQWALRMHGFENAAGSRSAISRSSAA